MWPQYTVLAFHAVALVANVIEGKGVLQTLAAPAIGLGLLYAGGFFAGLGFAP